MGQPAARTGRPGNGARMVWVATPPGGARPPRPRAAPRPYTGPPSYPAIPHWGFPLVSWRWPLAVSTRPQADPVERVAALGATASPALWVTAISAGVAAIAECLRYVLLLLSINTALPTTMLVISDALVITAGFMTLLVGALSGVVVVLWGLRARNAADARVGVRSARPDWQFIAGVLVPGWNLFVPGSVLAEVEHTVLVGENARQLGSRPNPSRLVRLWWACWVLSLLLGWTTFLWSFLGGVQAQANGVVLHIWTNLAVVALAVLTVRVVNYLTRLLRPVDPTEVRRWRVLDVRDAPPPRRAERPSASPR